MEINIEKIIQLVTKQVVEELRSSGVKITYNSGSGVNHQALRTKTETIDMSKYKTPVLTENHIRRLHELTGEVIVPEGTVITPKAREMIKDKRIEIRNS